MCKECQDQKVIYFAKNKIYLQTENSLIKLFDNIMATFFDRRNTYLLNAETLRFGQDRLGINEHLKKLFCMRFNSLVAIEVRLG